MPLEKGARKGTGESAGGAASGRGASWLRGAMRGMQGRVVQMMAVTGECARCLGARTTRTAMGHGVRCTWAHEVRGARVVCLSVCGFLVSGREETGEFLRRQFLARRRFLRHGRNGFYVRCGGLLYSIGLMNKVILV